jgi:hypothetical protein
MAWRCPFGGIFRKYLAGNSGIIRILKVRFLSAIFWLTRFSTRDAEEASLNSGNWTARLGGVVDDILE